MAKYKQGYSDRKDESMGMRNGPEKDYKQSYKDRRDESYGMNDMYYGTKDMKNMSYGMKDMGIMSHEKKPYKCDAFGAQKRDMNRVDVKEMDYRGSPDKSFNYKY